MRRECGLDWRLVLAVALPSPFPREPALAGGGWGPHSCHRARWSVGFHFKEEDLKRGQTGIGFGGSCQCSVLLTGSSSHHGSLLRCHGRGWSRGGGARRWPSPRLPAVGRAEPAGAEQ